MKKAAALFILLMLGNVTHSQTLMNRDSLLKLLPVMKGDTNLVLLYINIGQQYETNEPEKAKQYYRMARDLSKKINYPRGVIKYIANYTYILNMQGMFDSSLILNLQSVELSRQIKDSLYLAKTLFNTGTSYRVKGEYENAVRYFEEGKKIFNQFGNSEMEAQADDILQTLYTDLKQYKRAIKYGERAVVGLRKANILPSLGIALNNLGLTYSYLKKFDKSVMLYTEALQIAHQIDDKNMEANQYLNLGDVFLQQGEYDKMKPYMEKALVLSKELELHEIELIATKGLSFYYASEKNYKLAQRYANAALALSYRFDFKIQRVKAFTQLSNLAFAMQDIKLGDYYATQSTVLGDSLLNETIQKHTLDLEKKYETEKKENQIFLQKVQLQKRAFLNNSLIGSTVTLLVIFLLFYRSYEHKQKLQEQQIRELEKEKQLTAAEAVLKGEEQERSRLAKDLHDGLGGMLSGIKFSFQTMKGNLIMTPQNQQTFERSMDMLDSSIKEMRRVAQNMMPESLVRFGLDTALQDYCKDINLSGALQVSYQSFGLADHCFEQTLAITIYRIIQELTNNILKHASAKTAIVQVTKSDRLLTLTIEDDGKGFDASILAQSKGMGWINIKHRVDFLKGKLDVNSQPGNGTSVQIEFDI